MTMRASVEDRPFRLFWLGQTASNLGDAFGFVAMPLLVFETTHSVVDMGYVTGIAGAGQLFAATFSGVVVDRVNRRRLMIACDLMRMALYGALPLAAWLGRSSLALICITAFLTAIASSLFGVSYMAAVANLVEADDLAAANSRLQSSQALTYVIGSAFAGVVCTKIGPAWALGVDALSFVASAATLASIVFRRDCAVDAGDREGAWSAFATGIKFLAGHPLLRALALFQMTVALLASIGIGAAVIDLVIYRLRVDFAQNSTTVGLCMALASLGAVLGAVLAARSQRRLGLGRITVAGTAAQAIGLLTSGAGTGVAAVTVGGMLWAGGLTFRAVAATSLRQTLTPDALLGRVVAAGWILIFGASALGAVLVTRLAAAVGTAAAMDVIGLVLLLVSLAGAASALGNRPRPSKEAG
jgi:hypothetical protein